MRTIRAHIIQFMACAALLLWSTGCGSTGGTSHARPGSDIRPEDSPDVIVVQPRTTPGNPLPLRNEPFRFSLNPAEMNPKLDNDILEAELTWWWKTPYRYGGTKLSGIDCSALMQRIYYGLGYDLPRTTGQQQHVGRKVSPRSLLIGDLLFFDTGGNGISHVGIYAGKGYFIHASVSKGVTVSRFWHPYYQQRFRLARRVVY